MMSHSKDTFKSMQTTNIMTLNKENRVKDYLQQQQEMDIDSRNKTLSIKKNNEFFLNDLNFMPVYEIKTLKQLPENEPFDIF